MKSTALGVSELSVPRISLGSNNFGTDVSVEESKRILDAALESDVNMIDTANIYTQGKSEEIIGDWAKGRREDVIIATKVGMEPTSDGNDRHGLSRRNIIYQLEKSMERLKTDYIDLYYIHQFDENTPMLETLKCLDSLIRENKVRYIACSNLSTDQISSSLKMSEEHGLRKFIATQSRYNILQREIENELIPFCEKEHLGVLAYSPLRSGVLAGRYERGKSPPEGTRASKRGLDYWSGLNKQEYFDKLEKLKEISKSSGIDVPSLSIAWVLNQGGVSSAVVGASTPEQFKHISKVADLSVPKELIQKIN